MAKRLIVRTRCPICGEHVKEIPDVVLRKNPGVENVEMVVTRTGYKQYIHSTCWYGMIKEQQEKRKSVG